MIFLGAMRRRPSGGVGCLTVGAVRWWDFGPLPAVPGGAQVVAVVPEGGQGAGGVVGPVDDAED